MKDRISQLGMVVSLDTVHEGWFVVSSWIKLKEGGYSQSRTFDQLSWTEACDVMLCLFDENRPGDVPDPLGGQRMLW